MFRSPIVAGNWKMHGDGSSLTEMREIAAAALRHPRIQVVICPPATLIERAARAAEGVEIGAQDCYASVEGAFTGRLSPSMLREAGAGTVIIGHSECRDAGDSDDLIKRKAEIALAEGLRVILCVGESARARMSGQGEAAVTTQISSSMPTAPEGMLAIAYEPKWAIGTGRVPTADQIEAMHRAIRSALVLKHPNDNGCRIPILYGGSVDASNARSIMSVPMVDGLLVGGASLTARSFIPVLEEADLRGRP